MHFGDFSAPIEAFTGAGFGTPVSEAVVAQWRFSYRLERKLLNLVLRKAKSEPKVQGPRTALNYQRLVNDGTFFARSPIESLHALYRAYGEHPKLTLACSLEMEGGQFNPQVAATTSRLLMECLRNGQHPFLQACMYIEHRARLALLKGAVDYCCATPEGPPNLPKTGNNIDWEAMWYWDLPSTFREGVDWLRRQPNFRHYAVFWQQFLWGWGGFYLADREQTEFEWMSRYSSVPPDEIPIALDAFNKFFPTEGGWLQPIGWSAAVQMKMVPMFFHGLGADHRRHEYGLGSGLAGLHSSGYTINDLARWHNRTVDYLAE